MEECMRWRWRSSARVGNSLGNGRLSQHRWLSVVSQPMIFGMRALARGKSSWMVKNVLAPGLSFWVSLATLHSASAENTLRVGNAAAFAIVNNPPMLIQFGSRNFIAPLLESYAEHEI